MAEKAEYGVDAPGVIRNLTLLGGIAFVSGIVLYYTEPFAHSKFFGTELVFTGIFPMIAGLLMIRYAKAGKFKQRERILALHNWKGDEKVLDVGTGLGLLMIGAAKKLSTGKAYGIDLWSVKDLSNNKPERTRQNTELESVAGKTEIISGNIMNSNLADASFDVVVSNLCLHNIEDKAGREKACMEISRLLTNNGVAIISDFKHTGQYAKAFNKMGMTTEKIGTYYFDTFPPLTIIRAVKK